MESGGDGSVGGVQVCAAKGDSEELRPGRACVNKLIGESTSLTARNVQVNAECDTWNTSFQKLELTAGTQNYEFGVLMQTVRLLKSSVAEGEDRANTVKALAWEML